MTNDENVIDLAKYLADHPDFHLTGSQYFGNTHAESDWDYYTDNVDSFRFISSTFDSTEVNEYEGKYDSQIVSVVAIKQHGKAFHLILVRSSFVKGLACDIVKDYGLYSVYETIDDVQRNFELCYEIAERILAKKMLGELSWQNCETVKNLKMDV